MAHSPPPHQTEYLQHLSLLELLGGDADTLLEEPLFEFSDDDSVSTDSSASSTASDDDDDDDAATVTTSAAATPAAHALRSHADATPTPMHFVPNDVAPGSHAPPPPTADAVGRRTRARVDLRSLNLEDLEAALDDRVDLLGDDGVDWAADSDYQAFLAAIQGTGVAPAAVELQPGAVTAGNVGSGGWAGLPGWDDDDDDDFCLDLEDDELLDAAWAPPVAGVIRMTRRSLFVVRDGERVVESVALLHQGLLKPLLPKGPIPNRPPLPPRPRLRRTASPPAMQGAPVVADGTFTPKQLLQLHTMLHQHVQLLVQSFALAVGGQCPRPLIEDFRSMLFHVTSTAAERIRGQDPWMPTASVFGAAQGDVWCPPPPPTTWLHSIMHLTLFAQLPDALCAIDAAAAAATGTLTVHRRSNAPQGLHAAHLPARLPWNATQPQTPKRLLSATLPAAVSAMLHINAKIRSRTASKRFVVGFPAWLPRMLAAMTDLDNVCDPALLPVVQDPHWSDTHPSMFEPGEDELIAWGIQRYGVHWEPIQATLLPMYEVHQVKIRAKNLASARSFDNPVKRAKNRLTAPLTDKEVALVRYGLHVLDGRPDKWDLLRRLLLPQRSLVTISRQWANARRERPHLADLSDKPGPPPEGPCIPDDWQTQYPYQPRPRTRAVDYGVDAKGGRKKKKKSTAPNVCQSVPAEIDVDTDTTAEPAAAVAVPVASMVSPQWAPPQLPTLVPIVPPSGAPLVLPPPMLPAPIGVSAHAVPTPLAAVETPPAASAPLAPSTRGPSSSPPIAKRRRLDTPERAAPVRPMEALAAAAMRQLATPPHSRQGAAHHVGAWTTEENRLIMEELADVARLDAVVCRAVWVAYTAAYGSNRRSYEEVLLQAGWLFERWLQHMAEGGGDE